MIARPLNEKTSDNVNFVWTEDMHTAFEELKVNLTSVPVLAYPDHEKTFVVYTDASSNAVGAVLSEADENGRDHPIYYTSRALYSAETNYSAFERQVLGVVFALKKFHHYLTSKRFKLYTDHQALKYVFNMKDPHGRIARSFTSLAEYDFEICYRAGRDNACADFLSRPVELVVIDDHQPFEANLKAIAHYLGNLSAVDEPISVTPEVKKKAKDFLVHDERLFRRKKYGISFLPYMEMRESILKGLYDEVGHWDSNST